MGAFTRVDNGTGVGLSVPFVHDDFAMLADTGLVPIRWGREELELAISINVTDLDLVNEGVSLLIQLDDLGLGTLSGWVVYGDHTAVVGGEDTKIQHTTVDGKLYIKMHSVFMTRPEDKEKHDFFMTVEQIEGDE